MRPTGLRHGRLARLQPPSRQQPAPTELQGWHRYVETRSLYGSGPFTLVTPCPAFAAAAFAQQEQPPESLSRVGIAHAGWFSPADWNLINKRVAARFQSVLDRADLRPAARPSAAAEETRSQQPMEVDAPAAPLGQPDAELAEDPVPNQELSDMTIKGTVALPLPTSQSTKIASISTTMAVLLSHFRPCILTPNDCRRA